MSAPSLTRAVVRSRALILLVVLTKLAATLVFGVAVSRVVAGFVGAHPAGELALFEGGAERLSELAPGLRVHFGWPLGSVLAYALLLVVPHGALLARVTGAADGSGDALRTSARRTGLLLLVFVLALFARVAALSIGVFAWPRFSGAGTGLLVVVLLVGWALVEGLLNVVRVHALSTGSRIGEAFSAAYHLRIALRAGLVTLAHAALQCVLGALGVALAARSVVQPAGGAVLLVLASVACLALSTSLFAAAHGLIARGMRREPSNVLPTSDELGYETAPSVSASPGSSVGRAED